MSKLFFVIIIGHVTEHPAMHQLGSPRNIQSMITYEILAEYFWKFRSKMHCVNVVNTEVTHQSWVAFPYQINPESSYLVYLRGT